MKILTSCMFDTNVFNRILDGVISVQTLEGRVVAYATHVQRDELDNTRNAQRRAKLATVSVDVVAGSLPTESSVLGVSRLGEAKLGGERVVLTESAVYRVSKYGSAKCSAEDASYPALKESLDRLNGQKPNNVHDALIAEASIRGGHVLVTDDVDLATVTKQYGGECMSVAELLLRCGDVAAT
jgi:hypothetical protein